MRCSVWQCVALCYSVFQCVAVCGSVLHCVTVCCNALQCVAVCCIALQCVTMSCSQYTHMYTHVCVTRMYTHMCLTRMYTLTIHPYIFHIKLNVCTHARVYCLQAYNLYDTQCMHIACVI